MNNLINAIRNIGIPNTEYDYPDRLRGEKNIPCVLYLTNVEIVYNQNEYDVYNGTFFIVWSKESGCSDAMGTFREWLGKIQSEFKCGLSKIKRGSIGKDWLEWVVDFDTLKIRTPYVDSSGVIKEIVREYGE